MTQSLYLDTARFGAILPECATMLREFATLLESRGQIPLFEEYLNGGGDEWPKELQQEFPTLASWLGIDSLKQQLLSLCGVTSAATVLFSGSSRQLARIAFHSLLHHRERILCSDLDWPECQQMLWQQASHIGGLVHRAELRSQFEPGGVIGSHVEAFANAFKSNGCDGGFLTPVSNDSIITSLSRVSKLLGPSHLVVDGSQQVGQMPVNLGDKFRGVYLAGTHKWLRSGVPLSFAICTEELRPAEIRKAIRSSFADDTLLLQTAGVGADPLRQTMRIEPLLAASIAVRHTAGQDQVAAFKNRQQNANAICALVRDLMTPVVANRRAGTVILKCPHASPADVCQTLARRGVNLSVLDDHHLRLACPPDEFTDEECRFIENAFASLARLIPQFADS